MHDFAIFPLFFHGNPDFGVAKIPKMVYGLQ